MSVFHSTAPFLIQNNKLNDLKDNLKQGLSICILQKKMMSIPHQSLKIKQNFDKFGKL
jgi:hypothetical protein